MKFICRPRAKNSDLERVYWDSTLRVKKELAADEITIPIPRRNAHIHPVPAKAIAVMTNPPSEKRQA